VRQWWDADAAAYRAVLERAARAIKRAAPDRQVILGGMVFPDADWIEEVCGGGIAGLLDVVPFHAYPETWTPPEVDVERYLGPRFPEFVSGTKQACGQPAIWINESGFATTPERTEDEQAEWWARAIATFAAAPGVEQIGVYEIKDLAASRDAIGGAPNYHLGLVRVDRSKKPAFAAVRTLVGLFGHGPIRVEDGPAATSREPRAPDVYRHVFELSDGRHIVFVWTKARPQTVDVAIDRRARRAIEYRLDGTSEAARTFDGRAVTSVRLTPGKVRVFVFEP
jgi:hypothetical protein